MYGAARSWKSVSGGGVITHKVTVAEVDMDGDGLLGIDVLRRLGAVIDVEASDLVVRATVAEGGRVGDSSRLRVEPSRAQTEYSWIERVVEATEALVSKYQVQNKARLSSGTVLPKELRDAMKADTRRSKRAKERQGTPSRSPMRQEDHPLADNVPVREVRVCQAISLPPYSECLVIGKVGDMQDGRHCLVEPVDTGKPEVRVARVIGLPAAGKVCVKAINITRRRMTLEKGTLLGIAHEIDPKEILPIKTEQSGPKEHTLRDSEIKAKLSHLEPKDMEIIEAVLSEYADVFGEPGREGCSLPIQHKIETGSARPIAKRPYRVPFHERGVMRDKIEEMLQKGIIVPSDSPWSAPVVLVKKANADGTIKYRFCTDFRGLNAVTRADPYPLPLIQETLEQLGTSHYFSTIDLTSGYHQIPIAPGDQEKTAFTTAEGHFMYQKMAFGLCGAPATFQRLMDRLLGRLKGEGCYVYLDDVVLYSETVEEHASRLGQVLGKLRDANLKANWEKCSFAASNVTYLGHVVTAEGVKPNPDNLKSVSSFPRPRSATEVRQFLGLAGYYRRFIPNFAEVARPLTQLTKTKGVFAWDKEQQNSFDALRTALCSEDVLVYPDFRDPFILATDASNVALGAVLSQRRDGQERPICYASRQLRGPELNYSATEKELLAAVWATKQFRCYLLGRRFKLVTDHAALKWLLSLRDPSSRLTRWALRLSEFDYEVEHKPGKRHTNADALSRRIGRLQASLVVPGRTELLRAQQKDQWCQRLVNRSKDGTVVQDAAGLCYYTGGAKDEDAWKVVIPSSMRHQVIEACHSARWAGHPGVARTLSVVSRSYYWPGLGRDVEAFVRACRSCASRKTPAGMRVPLSTPYIATQPFEMISMDIVGPLPKTPRGNKYILTIIDHFTRYAEGVPLREQTAEETAKGLMSAVITRHGIPLRLLTDQGRNFVSALFKGLCHRLGIRKLQTTAYHPESNGVVERLHRTLTDSIAHFVRRDGRDWDQWVPFALMAYRAIPHSSTGFSPNFLLFGREVRTPTDPIRGTIEGDENHRTSIGRWYDRLTEAFEEARRRMEHTLAKRAEYCNQRRRERNLEEGDWVYLNVPAVKPGHCAKFHCPWTGPHLVTRKKSMVTYEVQKDTGERVVVHLNRLKRAFGDFEAEKAEAGSHSTQGPSNRPRIEVDSWEGTQDPEEAWNVPVTWYPLADSDDEIDTGPSRDHHLPREKGETTKSQVIEGESGTKERLVLDGRRRASREEPLEPLQSTPAVTNVQFPDRVSKTPVHTEVASDLRDDVRITPIGMENTPIAHRDRMNRSISPGHRFSRCPVRTQAAQRCPLPDCPTSMSPTLPGFPNGQKDSERDVGNMGRLPSGSGEEEEDNDSADNTLMPEELDDSADLTIVPAEESVRGGNSPLGSPNGGGYPNQEGNCQSREDREDSEGTDSDPRHERLRREVRARRRRSREGRLLERRGLNDVDSRDGDPSWRPYSDSVSRRPRSPYALRPRIGREGLNSQVGSQSNPGSSFQTSTGSDSLTSSRGRAGTLRRLRVEMIRPGRTAPTNRR